MKILAKLITKWIIKKPYLACFFLLSPKSISRFTSIQVGIKDAYIPEIISINFYKKLYRLNL
jgi:hypothetical protein